MPRIPLDEDALGETLDGSRPSPDAVRTVAGDSFSEATFVDPGGLLLDDRGFADRYAVKKIIGQGGMGEVRLCHDGRIGRDVAMKVIRGGGGARAEVHERFIREARVQGQLEHPVVVPVYDLGVGPDGEAFFTMKRVRGVTLEEILRGLSEGTADFAARYSRRRLLTAFSQICVAMDFAHRRGVLHRDLKPGNLMLGDFGEVYILDWGLAKLADHADLVSPGERVSIDEVPEHSQTQAGTTMGTPGYMSPEQARGETAALGPATDIYALGSILFEILAGEPLHRGTHAVALLTSTLTNASGRPSLGRPERAIPPELDDIVLRATSDDAAARHENARALHEAIERFLDGDRDLERRREMAIAHAQTAEAAAARSLLQGVSPSEREAERRRALREVGRALALEPDSAAAMHTLVSLLTEPPAEIPRAAQAALDRSLGETVRISHRLAGFAYFAWSLFIPILLLMGIRDWTTFLLSWPLIPVIGVLNLYTARNFGRDPRRDLRMGYLVGAINAMATALGTRMFGPFIVTPSLVAMTGLFFAMHPDRRLRITGITAGCLAMLIPVALEWTGILSPSYRFENGMLLVMPSMFTFSPRLTLGFLFITSLAVMLSSSVFLGFVRDALITAERRQHLQTWNLRQLIPDELPAAPANQ